MAMSRQFSAMACAIGHNVEYTERCPPAFEGAGLSPKFSDALGAAYKVVQQSAEPMGEDYDQDPNHFVVAAIGLLGCALDDHNDPEDGAAYNDDQEE
jgi:hypothetical protein